MKSDIHNVDDFCMSQMRIRMSLEGYIDIVGNRVGFTDETLDFDSFDKNCENVIVSIANNDIERLFSCLKEICEDIKCRIPDYRQLFRIIMDTGIFGHILGLLSFNNDYIVQMAVYFVKKVIFFPFDDKTELITVQTLEALFSVLFRGSNISNLQINSISIALLSIHYALTKRYCIEEFESSKKHVFVEFLDFYHNYPELVSLILYNLGELVRRSNDSEIDFVHVVFEKALNYSPMNTEEAAGAFYALSNCFVKDPNLSMKFHSINEFKCMFGKSPTSVLFEVRESLLDFLSISYCIEDSEFIHSLTDSMNWCDFSEFIFNADSNYQSKYAKFVFSSIHYDNRLIQIFEDCGIIANLNTIAGDRQTSFLVREQCVLCISRLLPDVSGECIEFLCCAGFPKSLCIILSSSDPNNRTPFLTALYILAEHAKKGKAKEKFTLLRAIEDNDIIEIINDWQNENQPTGDQIFMIIESLKN